MTGTLLGKAKAARGTALSSMQLGAPNIGFDHAGALCGTVTRQKRQTPLKSQVNESRAQN